MITTGDVCTFSFYVRAFDTRNGYANYGDPLKFLSLEQAKAEFARRCAQNPLSVNTMLGVDYATMRRDLDPNGIGAVDMLQCINGHLKISDDYKLSSVLSQEKLIAVNAVAILKREADRLQRISDNATAKCAKEISDNINAACASPEAAEQYIKSLADEYGIERCKDIIANELIGNHGMADSETMDYLIDSFSGKYDSKFAVFGNTEQLERLAHAAHRVEESGLSETESKLHNSGFVYGDSNTIRDKSADIKSEIEHHNDLEDKGLVPDDGLSL